MRDVDFLKWLFVVERHDLSPFYKGFREWVRVWEYDVNGFRGYLCKFIKIIFSFCKIMQTIYAPFSHIPHGKIPTLEYWKIPTYIPLFFNGWRYVLVHPKNEEKPHDTP